MPSRPRHSDDLPSSVNIRRCLAILREKWADHSPARPFCMADLLQEGVIVSDFCVSFLLLQRSKRNCGGTYPCCEEEGEDADEGGAGRGGGSIGT